VAFRDSGLGFPLGPMVLMAQHFAARSVDRVGGFVQW
jgi:hypothetical protein